MTENQGEIKRHEITICNCEMGTHPDTEEAAEGNWVRYDDHEAALRSANERANETQERLQGWVNTCIKSGEQAKALGAELAAAKEKIAAMDGEDHADRCAQSKRLKLMLEAEKAKSARLREALAWYSNTKNYSEQGAPGKIVGSRWAGDEPSDYDFDPDFGQVAESALSQDRDEKEGGK